MNPVLIGVLVYVAAQFAIGMWVSRKIATEDDYFVAGRRLGMGLSTFSIFATWFGAETCVGAAGAIYSNGLSRSSVEPFAYGVCLLVMGFVFAAPFWRAKVITIADLFRERYSPGVERFAAVLLIPTSVLWAAAQIHAFGEVLSEASQLAPAVGITIAAGIVVAYTAAGGMMSDVITDLVQAIALTVGLVVLLVAVVIALGGADAALQALSHARVDVFTREGPGFLDTVEAWALPICGSVVAQEAISRAVSSRSERIAKRSVLAGGSLYIAVGTMPVLLGLLGARLVPNLESPERILPVLAQQHLNTFGYVLFAGAIISAILSTVDSTLLVASSLLSRNLILSRHGDFSQNRRVLTARLCVAGFGVVAWLLALSSEGVLDTVEDASGFGSSGILVIVAFGLFTRFGGPRAALASLGAGIGVWILGHYLVDGWPWPYLSSLAAALLAFIGVGAMERAPGAGRIGKKVT
ncbi:MAG: sodium:solute symporter family protein [Planctomycetes bacterium]|nr:sodium:solute symporter family protein [Planctomycetota bacterium]